MRREAKCVTFAPSELTIHRSMYLVKEAEKFISLTLWANVFDVPCFANFVLQSY